MKVPFVAKLGRFIGTLTVITIVALIVCVLLTIVTLTAKFMVWLFL